MIDYAHTVPVVEGQRHILLDAERQTIPSGAKPAASLKKTLLNKKKISTFLLFVIIGGAVAVGVRTIMTQKPVLSPAKGVQLGDQSGELAIVSVEREFSFKAYDKDKKLSDPIKYTVNTAQLTKQIIVKGQKATAVKGRTFLIINLKLVNQSQKSLYLNTRNYLRVQPAGTEDKLAPEIHNDTVEVQPLSTKLTRVGLPVDESQKEFTLLIGEIDGKKESVNLKFTN